MHHWNPMFVGTRFVMICGVAWLLSAVFGMHRLGRVVSAPFRLLRFLALLVLVGLAGCASHEKLAVASGPTFALNQDHWQATPEDLASPDLGK